MAAKFGRVIRRAKRWWGNFLCAINFHTNQIFRREVKSNSAKRDKFNPEGDADHKFNPEGDKFNPEGDADHKFNPSFHRREPRSDAHLHGLQFLN